MTAPIDQLAPATLRIGTQVSTLTLRQLPHGALKALLRLSDGPVTMAELLALAGLDGKPSSDRFWLEVEHLFSRFAIKIAIVDDDGTVAELTPNSQLAAPVWDHRGITGESYRASQYTLLRHANGVLLFEQLVRHVQIHTSRPLLATIFAALADAQDLSDVSLLLPGTAEGVLPAAMWLLALSGAIERTDTTEADDPALTVRQPHDLFLHNNSRRGLSPGRVSASYRFAGQKAPLPALREPWPGESVVLPRPDLDVLRKCDPPLADVMERRRSVRTFQDTPLTLPQIGEFLYRIFRVKSVVPASMDNDHGYESTRRAIPSAGGMHDLEVYVAVGAVADLERLLYHYHPANHTLTPVCTAAHVAPAFVQGARQATGCDREPAIVVVLASRFGRLAWKYEGLPYSLTLRNVGVAYDAMYLVATAMGLAGCGLGTADSALFGAATGIPAHVESSVGEFMLGTPRAAG
ncbi:SagB family peptide dehydrogenase [Fodinicola feengrottensis]|uniref:SagB family peptide dehydrogenase n=1 Tax=Fodinicola feengrottensis TaxID=435914 RepID=UPI0031D52828